jgi:arylsulfatase A-like enzyme
VAFADDRVGSILGLLGDARDDTFTIVVADHGESIVEHDLINHQFSLYENLLRVPMIFRLEGTFSGGKVVDAPVQLVDVAPTVLDVVGVDRRRWSFMEGASLVSGAVPPDRASFAEYMRPLHQRKRFAKHAPAFDFEPFDRRLKSIPVGGLKLILAEEGEAELYDLETDPGETRNLAEARPDDVRRLEKRLRERFGAWPPPPAGELPALDAETLEQLRSLGYVP